MKNILQKFENLSNILNEINNVVKAYSKNSTRNDKAIAHNKVNKHAMHLLRLYKMANELMQTGTVCTYRSADHNLLMAIRNGEYSLENGEMNKDFFELVKKEEERFNSLKDKSVLSDLPNYEKIKLLQREVNEMIIKEELNS